MPEEWGWTSYKRTGIMRNDADGERRLYYARFRTGPQHLRLDYREQHVRFWAKRPILAMRDITDSGREPQEFDGHQIN